MNNITKEERKEFTDYWFSLIELYNASEITEEELIERRRPDLPVGDWRPHYAELAPPKRYAKLTAARTYLPTRPKGWKYLSPTKWTSMRIHVSLMNLHEEILKELEEIKERSITKQEFLYATENGIPRYYQGRPTYSALQDFYGKIQAALVVPHNEILDGYKNHESVYKSDEKYFYGARYELYVLNRLRIAYEELEDYFYQMLLIEPDVYTVYEDMDKYKTLFDNFFKLNIFYDGYIALHAEDSKTLPIVV